MNPDTFTMDPSFSSKNSTPSKKRKNIIEKEFEVKIGLDS